MSDAPSSRLPAAILSIFLIVIVDVFGMTLVLPLLPFYAERFGASPLGATLLISVYAVCQLFSSPQIGRISDHIGRKPMLIVSQVGTCLGFILLANADWLWPAHALFLIYLSRIIDGATAGNLSIAQAYIADHTTSKNRTHAFAIIGIAFGLGFFIGPMLSGYLSHVYRLETPIYLAAMMSAASILCTAFLLPGGRVQHEAAPPGAAVLNGVPSNLASGEASATGRRLSVMDWALYVRYFRHPVIGRRLTEFLCLMLAFSMFMSGFALFAERRFLWHGEPWHAAQVGYLFGYVGFLGIILQGGLIRHLVARFGEPRLVTAGFISLLVSYFGLGLTHTLTVLLIMSTISAFGHGVLRPTLSSLVTQEVGRREHGVVLGLTTSLQSVASIFAPVIAGMLINDLLLVEWAWTAAAAAGAGLILTRRDPARHHRAQPAHY